MTVHLNDVDLMLQRSLQAESEQTENQTWIFQNFIAFIACTFSGLAVILVCHCCLQEYIYKKWGYDCCPGHHKGGRRRSREEQLRMAEDERVAVELQRDLEEEERHHVIEGRRKERREKYETFLAPYTMGVTNDDLFYASERKDDSRENRTPLSEENGDVCNSKITNDVDIEAALSKEERELFLRLPVKNDDGVHRHVDGNCSICLLNYEAGDKVVWATRKVCHHAFHDECILLWLSTGKKRCPICRQFFVPGARVDQKEAIAHDPRDPDANILVDETSHGMDEEDSDESNVTTDLDGSQRVAAERVLSRRLSAEVDELNTFHRNESQLQLLVRHLTHVSETVEEQEVVRELQPIIEELTELSRIPVVATLDDVQRVVPLLLNLSARTGDMDTSRRNISELRVIARRISALTSEDLKPRERT